MAVEPGACEICSEKVWGSQPICFGCFTDLDVESVQSADGTEYEISSYEYDGDEGKNEPCSYCGLSYNGCILDGCRGVLEEE